ncbi:dipeptide ABC transporter ATP-binding protein [Bradyrhizobium sp. HKCCYLS3077]|uniref:dipeptide ABC transporter ATP-binding protein n=1 Tax=Bradyrhizobium sp. HKCCYLS3077 TaxID=3420761 RepID=UPI003EB9E145
MPNETAVIDVRGLTVAYGARAAISDFALTIAPGEVVGLTGDSGSGKSTLALALLGLTRGNGRIVSGQIMMQGTDLLALDEAERREWRGRDIGLIVQNPRSALSPLHQVGSQIADVYRSHHPVSARQAEAHAVAMLRNLGLNDPERRAKAYPHEISGGMAQRVLIAMALGSGPRLVVADEPTSGLDVTIQAQFLDEMWRSVREAGSAALLMTQDLGIIANYCDRVIVLQDGRKVEDAPTASFYAAPRDDYSRSILARRKEATVRAAAVTPLLSISGLRKTFPLRDSDKRVQAVDDVSFTVGRGETLGLVGESGSGKTTVGRAILRLVEPDAGEIDFSGRSLSRASPRELRLLRRKMQIVFQDPLDSLDPRWTVADLLAEAIEPKADRTRINELLELVGLSPETARLKPRALSAGAQQRVNIARAVAVEPDLIVLDEPTSALTPLARLAIIRLLRSLQERLGVSYVFISHDLNTVEEMSHRVAVMYLGQIVEIGTREQIFRRPLHPYSKALLAAHLVADSSHRRVDRTDIEALSGEIPSPIDLPRGCYLAGRCPVALPSCSGQPQPLLAAPDGRLVRCAPAIANVLPASLKEASCI